MAAPRFIADAMLGSLAKWLRIIGFDTLYYRAIEDNELIRIAKQEGRILLTRDTGICRSRKAADCLLIHREETFEQLKEVLKTLGTSADAMHYGLRCSSCNGELSPVDRDAVSSEIAEHVYRTVSSFFRCGTCGKVYWEGSHKKLIDAAVAAILKETEGR